jgi:hypothetical protein
MIASAIGGGVHVDAHRRFELAGEVVQGGLTSMAAGGARTELGKKLLQRSSWLLDSVDRLGVVL